MHWLVLACTSLPPPPGPPARALPPDTSTPASGDTESGPSLYTDPVVRLEDIAIGTEGLHITDVDRAGDHLVFVGEDWSMTAGFWQLDLGDPDSPVLVGATDTGQRLRTVCVAGDRAWALGESGDLMGVALDEDGPRPFATQDVADRGEGIDCDEGRVAWGRGADGGELYTLREDGSLGDSFEIPGEVRDVLIEGEVLWSLAHGALTAWTLDGHTYEELGHVDLEGTCRDLAAGEDWIAMACGAAGVALVARRDGAPELLGTWEGHISARTVAVQDSRILVAGWTELVVLDATDPTAPWLVATEPAFSSVMSVAAGPDDRAYAADWSRPFAVRLQDSLAPEARASPAVAVPGTSVSLHNDGPAPLWLGSPSQGELSAERVEPGQAVRWSVPADAPETLTLPTDDPDEALFTLSVGAASGLQLGDPAPDFIEQDLQERIWELSSLRDQVVFHGLFDAG